MDGIPTCTYVNFKFVIDKYKNTYYIFFSGQTSALHGNHHRLAVSQSPSPAAGGISASTAVPSGVQQQQPQPQINLQLQPLSQIVSEYGDLGNSMPVHKRFRVSAPSEEANANWS